MEIQEGTNSISVYIPRVYAKPFPAFRSRVVLSVRAVSYSRPGSKKVTENKLFETVAWLCAVTEKENKGQKRLKLLHQETYD